ncbi:hypothetical protein COLO4_13465 [Corchorus olitorius]|uniref:Uncharacterized protein n=1 Tax=Corchorus olitorius TaxID=93759 RepID=A0A1R3JWE1_9ROSI|nr:hypothetical protein COLO4_13465 [Corchorus olitorius]
MEYTAELAAFEAESFNRSIIAGPELPLMAILPWKLYYSFNTRIIEAEVNAEIETLTLHEINAIHVELDWPARYWESGPSQALHGKIAIRGSSEPDNRSVEGPCKSAQI